MMRADERGEMLIELLMSIAILGIVVAGALGGLGSAIVGYKAHRQGAQLDTLARGFAEQAKAQIQLQHTLPYVPCANSSSAYPVVYAVPSDYSAALYPKPTITKIEAMEAGPVFVQTFPSLGLPCSSATDLGAQRLTVLAKTSATNGPAETFQLIVRRP